MIKRQGFRDEFNREKLLNSLIIACRKRPIPVDVLREAAECIERDLYREFEEEVPSTCIGDRALSALLEIDLVAYIRFASVYREFESIDDFATTIKQMTSRARKCAPIAARHP